MFLEGFIVYALPTVPLLTKAVEFKVKSKIFSLGDNVKAPFESLNSTLDEDFYM
jgi:hypothetical protein